jgi:hypothetical protein
MATKFMRRVSAAVCKVPSLAGERLISPGDTLEVPDNQVIYFRSTQDHDTGWDELTPVNPPATPEEE